MKRGLKHGLIRQHPGAYRRRRVFPDEEGIETDRWETTPAHARTASPMKRGLKLSEVSKVRPGSCSDGEGFPDADGMDGNVPVDDGAGLGTLGRAFTITCKRFHI